jgi:hypothetical protein
MLDGFDQQVDAARTVLRAGIIAIMLFGVFTAIFLWIWS